MVFYVLFFWPVGSCFVKKKTTFQKYTQSLYSKQLAPDGVTARLGRHCCLFLLKELCHGSITHLEKFGSIFSSVSFEICVNLTQS